MSIRFGLSPHFSSLNQNAFNARKSLRPQEKPGAQPTAHQVLFGRVADASAKDIASLDIGNTYSKLKSAIDKYTATDPDALEKLASHFRAENHPALYTPEATPEQKFHKRTGDLNEIPVFFSEEGTEIAKVEDTQQLPPGEKVAASVRLIAKRFLDSENNKSFFTKSNLGQASPTLQMQERPVREIRAEAATASTNRYWGIHIANLYQYIFDLNKDLIADLQKTDKSKLPLTVYVMRPGRDKYARDCSTNFLTVATHTEVTDSLNYLAKLSGKSNLIQFSDKKHMAGLERGGSRTTSTPKGRIGIQGYYNTSEIKPGDQVVIVDDHIQAGGTIKGMAAAVKEAGGKVIAAATSTAHPLSVNITHPFKGNLEMSPAVRKQLQKTLRKWDSEELVQNKLRDYGQPVSTLTNYEAMAIIAYATDPSDAEAVKNFETLEASLHTGEKRVLESANDSLTSILKQPRLSAKDLALELETEVNTNRRTTKPLKIQQVHVFDYDDCLTNEQGTLYQLMHNTFQIVAQNYGKQYPFLAHLAETMKRTRGQYQPGMPLLCMDKDQYAHTVMHGNIDKAIKTKKAPTLHDLWKNLGTLDPSLKAEFDAMKSDFDKLGEKHDSEKLEMPEPGSLESRRGSSAEAEKKALSPQQQTIENILWYEFKRQYQNMITARPIPSPHVYKDLPFPDVKPTFMPGAQDVLEKLRRPENLVILLSNKADSELNKEINTMGWAHYFDVISGKPNQLTRENDKYVTNKRLSKPHSDRLEQIAGDYHNLDDAFWTFWGDTVKDGTQVLPTIDKGKIPADKVTWMMINPNAKLKAQAEQEISQNPDLFGKIKIRFFDTMNKLPLSSLFPITN